MPSSQTGLEGDCSVSMPQAAAAGTSALQPGLESTAVLTLLGVHSSGLGTVSSSGMGATTGDLISGKDWGPLSSMSLTLPDPWCLYQGPGKERLW